MACKCEEGFYVPGSAKREALANLRGVGVTELTALPTVRTATDLHVHDCAYVEKRNTLIPQAEKIADKEHERNSGAWSIAFHRAMNKLMADKKVALTVVALLFFFAGCSSMQAPTLYDNTVSTTPSKPLSDVQILQFGESLIQWWGARSMRTEAFGTGAGIALDAMTTGALAATGGGVSPDIVRGLVAGVNFISALIKRIDPGARDNAFNEGSGIVLDAQGEYMKCITVRGNATPTDKTVSACGAAFLAKVNSAVKVVGSLMAGLMPQKADLDKVQPK